MLGKGLVVAQVGFSLMLMVGAGLFLRTLWNLQAVDLGYPKEKMLVAEVEGLSAGYKEGRLANLYHDVADRLRALPGVLAVTYSRNGLFVGHEFGDQVEVEGFRPSRDEDKFARGDEVGPAYFSTIGIPVLAGREVTARDTAKSARVCVVNEAFVKRFFAGIDPIGKHVTDVGGGQKITMEVVGVVRNARDHGLRETVFPRFYAALDQGLDGIPAWADFEVRTKTDPQGMRNSVRKAILDVNGELPVRNLGSLEELIADVNVQSRLVAQLCSAFGALALALAGIGLYGVLSYGVAQRRSEIGIRMALGADRKDVVALVLGETCIVVVIGIMTGLLGSAFSTRLITTRLYGVAGMDSTTILVAVGVLLTIALIAGSIPAARAARVDPITALKYE
jgi:predicted permease